MKLLRRTKKYSKEMDDLFKNDITLNNNGIISEEQLAQIVKKNQIICNIMCYKYPQDKLMIEQLSTFCINKFLSQLQEQT